MLEIINDFDWYKDIKENLKYSEEEKEGEKGQFVNIFIMKKIKIISLKGVINFNGEIVRKSRVNSKKNLVFY